VNRDLVRRVWRRAGDRCEYCRIPRFAFPLPFQIDHILAEKHGGVTIEGNLALACPHCNRFKGPSIAGLDPDTGELTRLFDPRRDAWADHFQLDGPRLTGRTPVGRATVRVLAMNANDLLSIRMELVAEDILFR
jgi:HNH endonuclease